TLTGARQALGAAKSAATRYDAAAAYTTLPSPGKVVRRGEALYAVDGQPVLLLYGSLAAWRAFRPGMSSGRDVGQLDGNPSAVGYGGGPGGGRVAPATRPPLAPVEAAPPPA